MDVLVVFVFFLYYFGMLFGLLWFGNRKSRFFILYLFDMGCYDMCIIFRLFLKVYRVGSCLDFDVLLVVI